MQGAKDEEAAEAQVARDSEQVARDEALGADAGTAPGARPLGTTRADPHPGAAPA
jgi:hypothetical protein